MDTILEVIASAVESDLLRYVIVGLALITAVEFFWHVTGNGSTARRREAQRRARQERRQKDSGTRP